ncbi:conserved protein, unknown function [Plasmodium sp. gorilla clade G2]|uniref:conserved protein, unknown function n=1 Tax=Plasmodium sp. gorilla clade G2 TaxID=880535 RepID=UPI000D2041A5|nr:conserved protein, unknown function [Plasmodium sp. gorilla clade G2]SOV11410.1 conserved protein, unknown function [Plasmodium sp. gorilla clade G2]
MGNTVPYNCYERWGKRTPDGPLLNYDPQMPNSGTLSVLLENFDYESTEENNNKCEYIINKDHVEKNNNMNPKVIRNARRRPTYSPTARKINIESDDEEEDEDDDEKLSTDDSDENISAKDIKDEKIQQYRKTLTKIVKIKTAIFHETVKVTCSKDGKMLEWYKGKNDSDGKKKPIGSFPLNKITSIRTKVDNLKSLEISVSSVHISTYLFTFKTREERESWQNNLESFRKIMSMK